MERLTNHVIAEVVLDHRHKGGITLRAALISRRQLVDNVTPPSIIRVFDAFLDNVAGELVLAVTL